MAFSVDPRAVRTYAAHLADAHQAAEAAKSYVNQHGSFSVHESGLFGMLAPGHRQLLASLNTMLENVVEQRYQAVMAVLAGRRTRLDSAG